MTVRGRHLLLFDLISASAVAIVAFVIRFDIPFCWPYLRQYWPFVPLVILLRLPIYYRFGLYRRIWRYASMDELLAIVKAVSLGSVAITAVIFGLFMPFGIATGFPRSVIVIEAMLGLLSLGGTRFTLRMMVGHKASERGATLQRIPEAQKPVLVVGAGDAGAMIVREMHANPGLGLLPIGFIDDDVAKLGMRIHNVPVLGTRNDISALVARHDIEEVIIAMPTVPGRVIREFKTICERTGVRYKTIPGVYELLDGSVSVSQIRDVQLEDLLRREPVAIDLEEVGGFLAGARVLVTGAGGSIGSELCRQVARYDPERLILLDHAETNVFYIHQELVTRFSHLDIVPVVCDMRSESKTGQLMGRYDPTIVFHSAALKHVPLMEVNVDEVVTNNIIGTQSLMEISESHGVKRFVLISTDKAVNPSSVMGASKRVAEMLVQDMARRSRGAGETRREGERMTGRQGEGETRGGEKSPCHLVTVRCPELAEGSPCRFVAVRFGNVLGSSGSVIPIFKNQIAAGGPVTVTHLEARRYFMTIPEAVQLVIQAAAMGKGGEIFVLDMGEPIKIIDLAMDLIALSGLEPGRDIDIIYTGLRPGEKLYEELFREGERARVTKHQHILIAEAEDFDGERLREGVLELKTLAREMDEEGIKRKLRELVPEYQLADRWKCSTVK